MCTVGTMGCPVTGNAPPAPPPQKMTTAPAPAATRPVTTSVRLPTPAGTCMTWAPALLTGWAKARDGATLPPQSSSRNGADLRMGELLGTSTVPPEATKARVSAAARAALLPAAAPPSSAKGSRAMDNGDRAGAGAATARRRCASVSNQLRILSMTLSMPPSSCTEAKPKRRVSTPLLRSWSVTHALWVFSQPCSNKTAITTFACIRCPNMIREKSRSPSPA
mmetsp:Transcript_80290/g.171910  ORF Transcript_80290/g.171910 Transcript_80290/m.171910 type:complete len:222 (-) Transcript_80290:42-707(-)